MKNVLFISFEYPPLGGGAGIVAHQLKSSAKKNPNHIKFLTEFSVKSKINVIRFESQIRTSLLDHNLSSYDDIILNDTRAVLYAGKYFSEKELSLCTVIIHGRDYIKYLSENIALKDQLRGYHRCHVRTLSESKAIVAVSQFIKRDLLNTYRKNQFQTNKVSVGYCGLEDTFLELPIYKHGTKSKSKTKRLLTVSRVVSSKGYLRMLGIFEKLVTLGIDCSWDIIGEGEYKEELENEVLKRNLGGVIRLHGRLEREQLISAYKDYDIFWLLPNKAEAFGLVYLEAQLSGVTVIGSDIGGVKEAINKNTGLVSNNDAEILDFILGFEEKDEYIEDNRRFAKRFRSATFLEHLLRD
ncbi:glycosyltransferase family 4 protein [Vibrio breoganii]